MGDGMILEQGTHNELLSSDGAYSRLVNAQKLRERVAGKDDDETAPPTPDVVDEKMTRPGEMTQAELEQAKRDEFPLGRTTTGSNRSIASELLEKRRQADVEAGKIGRNGEKEYSMTYLFRRMGKISASDWKKYALGSCFASRTFFFESFAL
jgi:ATP-binding cassette subfamily B (MDR/TAP) protein 1